MKPLAEHHDAPIDNAARKFLPQDSQPGNNGVTSRCGSCTCQPMSVAASDMPSLSTTTRFAVGSRMQADSVSLKRRRS